MGLVRIALKLKYYEGSRILYERYSDVTLFNPINTYRVEDMNQTQPLLRLVLESRVFPI